MEETLTNLKVSTQNHPDTSKGQRSATPPPLLLEGQIPFPIITTSTSQDVEASQQTPGPTLTLGRKVDTMFSEKKVGLHCLKLHSRGATCEAQRCRLVRLCAAAVLPRRLTARPPNYPLTAAAVAPRSCPGRRR